MSVDFKRIKKYSKASKEIDEKLEFLNKELKKTGMCESIANTTAGVYVGSKEEENKNFSDFESLSHNGQGLGFSGADGNHIGGAIVDSNGVALSPPHPVTGARTTALHVQNGTGNTIPLRPGKTTTRGDGNNPPIITMGSAVWFFDPTFDSGQGKWCNLEYFTAPNQSVGALGFWDTNNAGFFFHNTNVSQHPCGDISSKIAGINFGANGVIGAEKTTVLTQTKLGDSGFLPINIPISKQAFFSLLGKAGKKLKDNFDSNMEGMGEKLKAHWSKSLQQAKNFVNTLTELGSGMSDQAFGLFDALNNVYAISSVVAEARKNGHITSDNQIKEGEKGSITNPVINTVSDAVAAHLLRGVDIGGEDMGKQIQQNVSASPLDGSGNWGSKGIHNNLPGKGVNSDQYPSPEVNDGSVEIPDTYLFSKRGFRPAKYSPTGVDEEKVLDNPHVGWIVQGYADARYIESRFGPNLMSDEDAKEEAQKRADEVAGWFDKSIGIVLPGIVGSNDPLVHFRTVISEDQIQRIRKRGLIETKNINQKLLSEAAKLGHFDPEVLNVDINDIRKGIMPEFPKDPPPEMINGYSAKSKLAPKIIEGEPFIKITKKDLAQNHKLKDSEIKEFMNQINAVNEFIKKNPAELKYAMIRYPKDDPRLAQLNWQMDQMLDASKEYTDKQFPENQKLFDKIKKKIKNTIDQTDPKNFKGTKLPKFDKTHLEDFKRKKEVYSRFMKKPVKTKKLFQKTKK